MSTFGDESLKDGHTLLLMEPDKNRRTYADYPNTITCLDNIVKMYEEDNIANDRPGSHDLSDFMRWIDSFYQIRMFVFDKTISRYRATDREGLKRQFEENPDGGSYGPTTNGGGGESNGVTTITVNGLSDHIMERDSENEDDWDE